MESSALGVTRGNIAPVAVKGSEIRRDGLVVPLAKCRSMIGRDGWMRGKMSQQQVSNAALPCQTGQRSERVQSCQFDMPGLYMRIVGMKAAYPSSGDKSKSTLTQLHHSFNTDFSSLEVGLSVQGTGYMGARPLGCNCCSLSAGSFRGSGGLPSYLGSENFFKFAGQNEGQLHRRNEMIASLSSSLCLSALMCYTGPAYASEIRTLNSVYGDVGAVLEVGVQLLYLGALLILLGVGSYLVVRQVLIKRELESAAKELQDRVRSGEASSLEYFELGAVMLRKKFYQVARKHLNDAIKKWDGSEQDLAQVYNALGYSYYSDGKIELAVTNYEKAVKLQPMYVVAWNNLADAYETQNNYEKALQAYEEALQFDPSNKVASAKREQMKKRVERLQGIPSNKTKF